MVCEKDRLVAYGQLTNGKSLMTHSKNNPYKGFNKNPKPHTNGLSHHTYNNGSNGSKPFTYCGKTNYP